MAELVQVMLRDERNGRMTCNVPVRPGVEVGNYLTLKDSEDPDKKWLITWRASQTRPAGSVPRGWGMTDI